jgi:hypothetical protein
VQNTSSDDDATMTFQTIGGGTLANRLTIDESGNSTFTGSVTATNFIGTLPTGQFLPLIGGTLTGALTGTTAAFNSGGTNVVASFTSTDPTGVIQIVDENGNVEIGAFGNNFVVQPAGGVAQLTVGSSSSTFAGNVGIGVTPSKKLDVYDSSTSSVVVAKFGAALYNTANNTYIEIGTQYSDGGSRIGNNNTTGNASSLLFETMTTTSGVYAERMRLTSGGDVLINRAARANGYDSGFKTLSVASNLDEKASILELIGTRSEGGNQNGMIHFYTDRVTLKQTAGITGLTGAGTNGYLAGELSFQTSTTTGSLTERMHLSSAGTLTVTTDSPNGSNGIFYNNSSTTPYGVACSLPNGSADNTRYLFFGDCAGASKFKVSTAGQIYAVATSIASISDIRFKENIRDIETGLEEILKLKPRLFDWKENKGKNEKDSVGFIAQEVEKVLPKLVQENWSDNGINEDGSAIEGEKYKTVSQADMIPTLVKAIQELKAEVDLLKSSCNCK